MSLLSKGCQRRPGLAAAADLPMVTGAARLVAFRLAGQPGGEAHGLLDVDPAVAEIPLP